MSTRQEYYVSPYPQAALYAERELSARLAELEGLRHGLRALQAAVNLNAAQASGSEAVISQERERLAEALAASEAANVQVAQLGREAVLDLAALQQSRGGELAGLLQQTQARLDQLSREVDFVTRDPALAVPSMLTLLAMEAGSYTLRETLSEEGLVAYFASADGAHEVAVRHAPVESSSAFEERWALEAETFRLAGESCLAIMEDFETACEEQELARLRPASPRHYPKRDGEFLPVPPPPVADRQPSTPSRSRETA